MRCTILFNRTDVAGWSESYYTDATTIEGAIANFAPVLTARRACLSAYCYVYGVRYTSSTVARQSRLILNSSPQITPSGAGTPNNFDPDIGVAGALGTFVNTAGRSSEHICRGLPDSPVEWSAPLNRMQMNAGILGPLNNFANALTSQNNHMGWFSRSTLLAGGSKSTPIKVLTTNAQGYVRLGVDSSAGFNPVTDGAIIVSGFKGPLGGLNGTYSALAWSVASPTNIGITKILADPLTLLYSGQGGFLRVQAPTFNAYTPLTAWPGSLVRSHRIGRPFGATRGRRRKAA